MSLYFESTCLLCDLPWKNNRVRYDDRLVLNPVSRHLTIGQTPLELDKQGMVRYGDLILNTGFDANDSSIALDALHKILYFASANKMVAYSLEHRCAVFTHQTTGNAGAPLLFEWLLPEGDICTALGFSDGTDRYIVLDRVTGQPLWQAHTLGIIADCAAHCNGYLYMTVQDDPYHILCFEADTGETVWWNQGSCKAKGGIICKGKYCVLCPDGSWKFYSLADGERLPGP